jgi:hypothetical protein
MPNYSFLKEAKVYIVYGTTKKQLDISSVSFSQTFTEETRSVKTLHNQNNMFEGSVINTANFNRERCFLSRKVRHNKWDDQYREIATSEFEHIWTSIQAHPR